MQVLRELQKFKLRNVFFIALLFSLTAVFAQVPQRPSPPRLYNNFSKEFPGFLSSSEAAAIEQKLQNFSNETSNQICVVVVDDLGGMDAGSYAFQLGNDWGVGKKGFNNGIVILIKPTGSDGGRDLFIATGYGLEGAIPDLITRRVRENEMVPYLKEGRNFEAINRATDVLMKLAKGEISVKDYAPRKNQNLPVPVIIVFVILFVILRAMASRRKGFTYTRGGRHVHWGGGFGGFGGFGGGRSGGGGGFGGFGGGSFGGGGSGGKW